MLRGQYLPTEFTDSIRMAFSIDMEKPALKFIRKCKGPKVAKIISRKNKVGGLTCRFQTYCKASVQNNVVLA